MTRTAAPDDASARGRTSGHGWSWTALIAAVVIWALGMPTWGFSVILAPVGLAFTLVAWRRSPHGGLFWVGATLNGLNMLGLIAIAVSILTGDTAIGFE